MSKFMMLIGLQGSGKSTFSKKLEAKGEDKVRVLSSDKIREAVLGSRKDQAHNGLVFDIMNRQAVALLKEGYDVVYDATNVSLKRRMALLRMIPVEVYKEAYYFAIPEEICVSRDATRFHRVGKSVIERTYKGLDVPMVFEGFDKIIYVDGQEKYKSHLPKEKSVELALDCFGSYDHYKEYILSSKETKVCVDFAQDNPHHTFSVSKHMYKAYTNILEKHPEEQLVLLAAGLHDCGKPYCREYKEDGYACFYGHDKVSAQIAVLRMMELGFDSYTIAHISTLINLHMRMHQPSARKKLFSLVGDDMYKELEILHEADSTAK